MYDSTYDPSIYETGSTSSDAGAFAAVFFGFFFITLVITYVINAIFLGMIFKKAGIESWKAWVPVYNTWVMLEMGGKPGWWSILALVPFVNIVAIVIMYIAMYQIGINFGKDGVFVILAIFLPIVWLIWLAVDKTAVWNPGIAPMNNDSTPPTPPAPSQPAAMQ